MKIIKFKKIGKNKYQVFFDNDEIVLFEDVILKYNLLSIKDLSLDLLNKILEDNTFYEIYNYALYYIDIKMRNEKELTEYLKKKNYDENIIDKVIIRLRKEGYLDDKKYVRAYINDKVNLSLYGPFKIKNELLKLNLDENTIEEYLNTISDEIWLDKINKIIEKKVRLNKKLSGNYLKQKISEDLYYLGYDKDLYLDLIESLDIEDNNTLEFEYKKVYKKYKDKYKNEKLKRMTITYLVKKGFRYDDIIEFIGK